MQDDHGATVYVVDDDASVRKASERLFKSVGLKVELFSSAREFLEYRCADVPGCLVLDIRMPGIGGLELQQELQRANVDVPIVFMSAHGDIPMTVRAMKAGAVDFLPKSVSEQTLLDAVQEAIERHTQTRAEAAELARLRERLDALTPREREVMSLVVAGLLNKQIAKRLGITETTVKLHRRHVMEKTGVDSVAELVQLAERTAFSVPKG